jgi:hypothetical protein
VHALGEFAGFQEHLFGAQCFQHRGTGRIARCGDDADAGMVCDIHCRLAERTAWTSLMGILALRKDQIVARQWATAAKEANETGMTAALEHGE